MLWAENLRREPLRQFHGQSVGGQGQHLARKRSNHTPMFLQQPLQTRRCWSVKLSKHNWGKGKSVQIWYFLAPAFDPTLVSLIVKDGHKKAGLPQRISTLCSNWLVPLHVSAVAIDATPGWQKRWSSQLFKAEGLLGYKHWREILMLWWDNVWFWICMSLHFRAPQQRTEPSC